MNGRTTYLDGEKHSSNWRSESNSDSGCTGRSENLPHFRCEARSVERQCQS